MKKETLDPAATQRLVPHLRATRNPAVWVYRYTHPAGWRLSIATHAEPGSRKLSLGGFRIAPAERTSAPGFDSDVEAIELAMGMEEKVYWSRVVGVAGPLARRDMNRIVGGKCVLHPSDDARVGQPRDRELLDFAIACLNDCDATAGIRITTGQDLGHGTMSDGVTSSLHYLHAGFRGSVVADTSRPTGEGNFCVLTGMLRAFEVDLAGANIGLVGVGNIGMHVMRRALEHQARVVAVESREERRKELRDLGVEAHAPEEKGRVLRAGIDALVVNASGGSLDTDSVRTASANPRLRVICGSENLVMPTPSDAVLFLEARKAYCPTELGGMMGYLTAVEQYLTEAQGDTFNPEILIQAARDLEEPACRATRRMIEGAFTESFEEAIEAIRSSARAS